MLLPALAKFEIAGRKFKANQMRMKLRLVRLVKVSAKVSRFPTKPECELPRVEKPNLAAAAVKPETAPDAPISGFMLS